MMVLLIALYKNTSAKEFTLEETNLVTGHHKKQQSVNHLSKEKITAVSNRRMVLDASVVIRCSAPSMRLRKSAGRTRNIDAPLGAYALRSRMY
jgi:hypothetical protein